MGKYYITYNELRSNLFVVKADSSEEAKEKLQKAIDNLEFNMDELELRDTYLEDVFDIAEDDMLIEIE